MVIPGDAGSAARSKVCTSSPQPSATASFRGHPPTAKIPFRDMGGEAYPIPPPPSITSCSGSRGRPSNGSAQPSSFRNTPRWAIESRFHGSTASSVSPRQGPSSRGASRTSKPSPEHASTWSPTKLGTAHSEAKYRPNLIRSAVANRSWAIRVPSAASRILETPSCSWRVSPGRVSMCVGFRISPGPSPGPPAVQRWVPSGEKARNCWEAPSSTMIVPVERRTAPRIREKRCASGPSSWPRTSVGSGSICQIGSACDSSPSVPGGFRVSVLSESWPDEHARTARIAMGILSMGIRYLMTAS